MTEETRQKSNKVEGEGSYSAAREYDRQVEKTVKSGTIERKAQEAKKAVEGSERTELERAEAEGKRHAHGEDPALRKNKKK